MASSASIASTSGRKLPIFAMRLTRKLRSAQSFRPSFVAVTSSTRGDELLRVLDVSFSPAGAGNKVLEGVNLSVPARGLTLLVGRSGTGKSTLLNLIAGLAEPTAGVISISGDDEVNTDGRGGGGVSEHVPAMKRLARVGLVFQFPERHFLGRNILEELTFAWPPAVRKLSTCSHSFSILRENVNAHMTTKLNIAKNTFRFNN